MELCEAYFNKDISINSLKENDLLYINVAIYNSNGVTKETTLSKVVNIKKCDLPCESGCEARLYAEIALINKPEAISTSINHNFYCCIRNIVSTSTGHRIIIKDDAACS